MSKLAKKPIAIPEGVEIKESNGALEVKGKQGTMTLPILPFVQVNLAGHEAILKTFGTHKQARANWGTMAALFKNSLKGTVEGFNKILELEGIGFRATMEGNDLVLNVGLTHPIKFAPPAGIKITVEKGTVNISGIDRSLVGLVAAQIRKLKPPEPYKGTGIHYKGEVIRRKAGKKVAAGGAGGAAS